MNDFSKPTPVTDLEIAFPASVSSLLPRYEDLPDGFRSFGPNPWVRLTERWFNSGLSGRFIAKPGIELTAALRHLRACMGSFEPKHEHKISGCAYLMSLWFERFEESK